MLELLKYVSFIFTVFTLQLLAVLNLYCIVDTHFQNLSFRVVDLLAEDCGCACIIGTYLVYQYRSNGQVP